MKSATTLFILILFCLSGFSQKEIHYDKLHPFEDGIAYVEKGKFKTFINKNGDEVLGVTKQKELGIYGNDFVRGDSSFSTALNTNDNRVREFFYFNTKGEILFKKKAFQASVIKNSFIVFFTNKQYQNSEYSRTYEIRSLKGKLLKKHITKEIYFSYPNMFSNYKEIQFFEKCFTINDKKNIKLEFFNNDGVQIRSNIDFKEIVSVSEGIIIAKKLNQYDEIRFGLLDMNLNVINDFTFKNQPSKFSSGLSKIKSAKTGLLGLMNKKGEVVIPPKYEFISNFIEGHAIVKFPNSYNLKGVYQGYRVIDLTGKELHWLGTEKFSISLNRNNSLTYYFEENNSTKNIAYYMSGFSPEIGTYNFINNTYNNMPVIKDEFNSFNNRFFEDDLIQVNKLKDNKYIYGYVNSKMEWVLINTEESEF